MSDATAASPVPALEGLIAEEVIDEVVRVLGIGKEATVYLVRKAGRPSTLYAAKVYRDTLHRSFRNDDPYREGRTIGDSRIRRAVANRSRLGRQVAFRLWVEREAEVLRHLRAAGADVPELVEAAGNALLMEYFGTARHAAPMLKDVRLRPDEAEALFRRLVENLRIFTAEGIVHADLSPYNILYHAGDLRIIDFPQAVDTRAHSGAVRLLIRDIANVCGYFARQGVRCSPEQVLDELSDLLPPPALWGIS